MGEGGSKLGEPGAQSPKKTPLDLAEKHFKHYFDTKTCSIPVLKEKCGNWVFLCPEHLWWPKEGTLFPPAISRLCKFLKANQDGRCLSDDLIYAEGWLKLSKNVRHTVKFKLLEWDTRRAIKQMRKKKAFCKSPAERMAIKQSAEEQSEKGNMLFSISPDQTDEQRDKGESFKEAEKLKILEEVNLEETPTSPCVSFSEDLPEAEKVEKAFELRPELAEEKVLEGGCKKQFQHLTAESRLQPSPPPFLSTDRGERGKAGEAEKPALATTERSSPAPYIPGDARPENKETINLRSKRGERKKAAEKQQEEQRDNDVQQERTAPKEDGSGSCDVARRPTPVKDRPHSCEARSQAPCPPPRTKKRKEAAAGQQPGKDTSSKKQEGGEMGSLSSDSNAQPSSAQVFPVRITAEISPGAPGQQAEIMDVRSHVPFSTSDLLNWTKCATQNLTWADIQQLQAYLLTEEQRCTVQENLEEAARGAATSSGAQDPTGHFARLAPTTNPNWSLNNVQKVNDMTQESGEAEAEKEGAVKVGRQDPTPPPNTAIPEDQKGGPKHSCISSFGSGPRVQPDLESSEILPGSDKECCLLSGQEKSMNWEGEIKQAESHTTALQGKGEKPLAAETQAHTQSDFSQLSFEANRDINTAAKNEILFVLTEVYQKFQNPEFRETLSRFLPLKQNNEIKAESPICPANHDERLIDYLASECSQQPQLTELTTALQGRLSHVKKVADQEKLSAMSTEAKVESSAKTQAVLNSELMNEDCQRESPGCESAQPTQNLSNESNVRNSQALICPSQNQSLPERHCQYVQKGQETQPLFPNYAQTSPPLIVDKERLDLPLQWGSKCHAKVEPEKETVSLPTVVPAEMQAQGDVSPVQSRENQSVPVSHSCYQPEEQSVPVSHSCYQPEEQSTPESHDCYQTEGLTTPVTPPLRDREGQQANLTPMPILEIEAGDKEIRDLDLVAQKSALTRPMPFIGRDLLYEMQASLVQAGVNPVNLTTEPIQESQKCCSPQIQPMLASLRVSPAIKEPADTAEFVYIPPKNGVSSVSLSLLSISLPQYAAIQMYLDRLLRTGETTPDWNTPLLTDEEPRIQNKCQPVQNLQAISEITADMTPDKPFILARWLLHDLFDDSCALQTSKLFLPQPATKQFCMFLEMIDHCRIWILDFAALAKSLCGKLQERVRLTWEPGGEALTSLRPFTCPAAKERDRLNKTKKAKP